MLLGLFMYVKWKIWFKYKVFRFNVVNFELNGESDKLYIII